MRLPLLMVTLTLFLGCAQTTVVKCWEPAKIDSSGINRIAVVDFSGHRGTEVSAALSARLWENNFYTLVDDAELDSTIKVASYSENHNLPELLKAASKAKVDGVVVGHVLEFRCDDRAHDSREVQYAQAESVNPIRQYANQATSRDSNQEKFREGTLSISFRLIDVETGDVRAAQQVTKSLRVKLDSSDGSGKILSEQEILDSLMVQCLDEVVEMLAPHVSSCELELAKSDFWTKGSSEVKAGLKYASQGDWTSAEERWQAAVEANPENHAALYNLSIAAARLQKYDEAEQHILNALKYEHKKSYTNGLEKIRERRSALGRANDQREARVANSCETLWK